MFFTSTLTKSIRARFSSLEIVDPDAIAREITGSFATVDQEQLSAGKKALDLVKRHIKNGQPFLVESTISGSTYLKFATQAKAEGFRTAFIYVGLANAAMSAARVASRVKHGGHAIPLEDVKRRYPRSVNNLRAHIKLFESAHIYDNSEHYQWIASFRGGMIHKAAQNVPNWIKEYLPL